MPDQQDDTMIRGFTVTLRPAVIEDRREIYRWLTDSDVAGSMMGPPLYPEIPIPAWDAFCADYTLHFFDGSRADRGRSFVIEVDGRTVGYISYDGLDAQPGVAELDIWMRAEAECGRGYGTDALRTMVQYMADNLPVRMCILRPSRRNARAVRAYQKAGFRPSALSAEEQLRVYGPGEFADTITLEYRMDDRAADHR